MYTGTGGKKEKSERPAVLPLLSFLQVIGTNLGYICEGYIEYLWIYQTFTYYTLYIVCDKVYK